MNKTSTILGVAACIVALFATLVYVANEGQPAPDVITFLKFLSAGVSILASSSIFCGIFVAEPYKTILAEQQNDR